MAEKEKSKVRGKDIPEKKKKLVESLSEKIKGSKTVLLASSKGLPASQFQKIKKKLRGKAEIMVAKKSAVNRAIEKIEKGSVQNLKKEIGADMVLFFSDMDAFELSALLSESQSSAKAKAGDIAPENINVEPGPTDLPPGPAISELSGVGLKVAVEGGKLAIKQGATIAKEGEEIKENVASVMAKLGIMPMKVGFVPLVAYDSVSEKVYAGIKIDKEGTLAELRSLISKAFGFAVNIEFANKETIGYLIGKAGVEEKAIEKLVQEKAPEEKEEEVKEEEKKVEEKEEEKPKEAEEVKEEKTDDKSTKEEAK